MSQCETCHAGCCRAFAIPVSGADIIQIMHAKQFSFGQIADRWPDPQGKIARGTAPHFFFADQPQTPYVICLHHSHSELFPETTKCMFLEESLPSAEHREGKSRCTIYHDRPATCRVFPATFNAAGHLDVHTVPEYGCEERKPAYKLCPQQWSVLDLNAERAAADIRIAAAEMEFFGLMATIWNRDPRGWDLFPDFLQLVYAERDQLEQCSTEVPLDTSYHSASG